MTTVTDEKGTPLDIEKFSQLSLPGFPILFTQNELLEILAKEIFMQQFIWSSIQNKDSKECNKKEQIFKEIPLFPRCPDMLKPLFNSLEIRNERSPRHAIAYESCLSKLEAMVKDYWEDWKAKQRKSSI